MSTNTFAITIDGPAGAGKTTMARALARALPGFKYIDTGAFYRLIACWRKKHPEDDLNSAKTALSVETGPDGAQIMKLDNGYGPQPVPDNILRSPETSEQASILSTDPRVRALANYLIRQYAAGVDAVMEGRDTGTAVIPDADIKFYLTADASKRTARRMKDLKAAGIDKSEDQIRQEIDARDLRDSTRKHDPLTVPEHAILIDNSDLTAKQCLEKMTNIARQALEKYGRA